MAVVAIFRTGGIGDVILSTLAINILSDSIPDVVIHWFGYSDTTGFINDAFPFVHTHDLRRDATYGENIEVVKNSAPDMDLVIDLQRSARTMIIGRRVAKHFKCSYITWNKFSVHRTLLVIQSRLRGRQFKTDLLKTPLPNRYVAMADCVINGMGKLNVQRPEILKAYKPEIKTGEIRQPNAAAINMGALYKSKELPFNKLTEIVSHLLANNTQLIYLLGDENKYADSEKLKRESGCAEKFENLCGKTSLWEAAKILSRCAFSIGNDSALAHLAESVGTPVLVFFGPTHEKFGYRPHLAGSKSFSADISCRPCTKGGNAVCRFGDLKCLNDISLVPVFEHLSSLQSTSR